jgi:uncharacterized membrane protein
MVRSLRDLLQGRFMNHPLHPILVHLPVGLWVASFLFDLFYLMAHSPILATVSEYCMGLGILGALLASLAGIAEFVSIPRGTRPKQIATAHLALNVVAIVLYSSSFFLRRMPVDGIPALAFLLSTLAFALLTVSGYLGGLLVYEFGMGVMRNRRTAPSSAEREPQIKRIA